MFELFLSDEAQQLLEELKKQATKQKSKKKSKSSPQQGLYKQVKKTLKLLSQNPRHPGLHTHEFSSLNHPTNPKHKVFEAYVQNNTPGAYRLFWCYGPSKNQITVLSIVQHP